MMKGDVDKLAEFILQEVSGEPSKSESAVDCAIRIIREQQRQISTLQMRLNRYADAYAVGRESGYRIAKEKEEYNDARRKKRDNRPAKRK